MNSSIFRTIAVALLLAVVRLASAGTVTYVYTDPQGTPLAEANASGTITATFDYKPYGSQALGSSKAGPGYTGHVNDPDTGFVYMQARYYDPVVGRFLSADPKTEPKGSLFSINRYVYVHDNPIVNIDPTGMQCGGSGEVSPQVQAMRDLSDGCNSRGWDSGSLHGQGSSWSASLFGKSNNFSVWSLLGISDAKAADRVNGGTQTIEIENPIFSFPGVPTIYAIKLSNATFEGHIKPRHAFDIGEVGAGRFSRGILNRTTSQSFFSSELSAMINQGEVVPAPYPAMPGGIRLFVTVTGSVGTTISGAPTSTVVVGMHPAGAPGIYSIDTVFPYGK